jgi:hypothetical protein
MLKYDHLVIFAQGNPTQGLTAQVNLPTFPDNGEDTYLGKRIFVYAEENVADSSSTVIVTAPGDTDNSASTESSIRKYNCTPGLLTYSNDTVTVTTDTVHLLLEYTTVPGKGQGFYYRECGGGGSPTGPAVVYDTLTSADVTAIIAYQGGDGVSILNPAAGRFVFVVQKDTHLHLISVQGDNTTLNANQEIELEIDNTANAAPRRGQLQLYDANNSAVTNQFTTGTVHTQATTAAVVKYVVPGLNGFGATGYIVEIQ